jgi:hypothetical protein
MSVPAEIQERVRERASFACEYCGVTETDVGGLLTVDHFRPTASDGSDDWDNLLYCCMRCNLYKAAYWPALASDPVLWNPRQETHETHFLLLADGTLLPLTPTGAFTIERLRLNRAPLVAHRKRRHMRAEEIQLVERYGKLLSLLEELYRQHAALLQEHRVLLEEQRTILRLLRPEA